MWVDGAQSTNQITLMCRVINFDFLQDPSSASRMVATRIKVLPKGSVSFLTVHPALYVGTIDKEPATHKNQSKSLCFSFCFPTK